MVRARQAEDSVALFPEQSSARSADAHDGAARVRAWDYGVLQGAVSVFEGTGNDYRASLDGSDAIVRRIISQANGAGKEIECRTLEVAVV